MDWDGTSQATVNLLLNRFSPWVDVASYLPYEGKVVLHNKKAKTLNVRIPAWVDKEAVKVAVDGQARACRWLNRYLLLGVKPKCQITITFPMVTAKETHIVRDFGHRGTKLQSETNYIITFKGNTAIDLEPRDNGVLYPTYTREYYKADKAPMKNVNYYIATKEIDW